MDPQDQSPSWRRLPVPGESPPAGTGPERRDRGIRRVQRLSNWTAAALVAATAVTAGYFSRGAAVTTPRPAAAAVAAGSQPGTSAARQPCVTVPVATTGGSGVTTQVPVRACGPGASGNRPLVIYVKSAERGD